MLINTFWTVNTVGHSLNSLGVKQCVKWYKGIQKLLLNFFNDSFILYHICSALNHNIWCKFPRHQVLTIPEEDDVREERGRQKVVRIISYLYRKPDEAFDLFIKSLRDSAHEHVANALEPPDRKYSVCLCVCVWWLLVWVVGGHSWQVLLRYSRPHKRTSKHGQWWRRPFPNVSCEPA